MSGKEVEVEVEVGVEVGSQPVSLKPNKRQCRQINPSLPSLSFPSPSLPFLTTSLPPTKTPTPKNPLATAKQTTKTKIKPPPPLSPPKFFALKVRNTGPITGMYMRTPY